MSSNINNSTLLTEIDDALPTNTSVATNSNATRFMENSIPIICQYYLRGICRFGVRCRFLHKIPNSSTNNIENIANNNGNKSWADAAIFVPRHHRHVDDDENATNDISYTYELCEMCDQYCLDPNNLEQCRQHKKACLHHHEQEMELSFAIARSKDKVCGICFDNVMEKYGREKRFGILPNCCHSFCLECIRRWRKTKELEHKVTRSCPECRISSDFVCPSPFWVDTKEDKDKLLNDYRTALGQKDCKYFKKGEGTCPFGNKCFYKHALPNGDIVDVGCPKHTHKRQRNIVDFDNHLFHELLNSYIFDSIDDDDDDDDDDDEDDDDADDDDDDDDIFLLTDDSDDDTYSDWFDFL